MNTQDKDALELAAKDYASKYESKNQDYVDWLKIVSHFKSGAEWQSSTNQPSTIDENYLDDYEMFIDRAYYDMWAVREIGERDFNKSFHFGSEQEALQLIEYFRKIKAKAANKEQSFTLKDVEDAFNAARDIETNQKGIGGQTVREKYNSAESYIAQLLKDKK